MPALARSEWYDLTRDMNWTLSYVDQEQAWPQELSNTYGIPAEGWWGWDEPYKVTYSEYVHNQVGKDAGVYSVNSVIGRSRMFDEPTRSPTPSTCTTRWATTRACTR